MAGLWSARLFYACGKKGICAAVGGFAPPWTENPKHGFAVDIQGKLPGGATPAGRPPDFSGRRPRFFAFRIPFPRPQKGKGALQNEFLQRALF